ncbi:MAG: hypothetical protein DCC52_18815 [Chloroflexi bacterium]|nr:MAG: hypothetical protein DCC52_18815 [Chloroflexota bacterium]
MPSDNRLTFSASHFIIAAMSPIFFNNPAANLTLLLMLIGLVGAVVPVVPGALLIWCGAFAWALGENFQRVDWLTLIALGLLALIATFSEYWLRPLVQARAGFGWKNILAAIVGGFAGISSPRLSADSREEFC